MIKGFPHYQQLDEMDCGSTSLRMIAKYDYKRFSQSATERNKMIQLIQEMQDIKLNNCERQKRWEWESASSSLSRMPKSAWSD